MRATSLGWNGLACLLAGWLASNLLTVYQCSQCCGGYQWVDVVLLLIPSSLEIFRVHLRNGAANNSHSVTFILNLLLTLVFVVIYGGS